MHSFWPDDGGYGGGRARGKQVGRTLLKLPSGLGACVSRSPCMTCPKLQQRAVMRPARQQHHVATAMCRLQNCAGKPSTGKLLSLSMLPYAPRRVQDPPRAWRWQQPPAACRREQRRLWPQMARQRPAAGSRPLPDTDGSLELSENGPLVGLVGCSTLFSCTPAFAPAGDAPSRQR